MLNNEALNRFTKRGPFRVRMKETSSKDRFSKHLNRTTTLAKRQLFTFYRLAHPYTDWKTGEPPRLRDSERSARAVGGGRERCVSPSDETSQWEGVGARRERTPRHIGRSAAPLEFRRGAPARENEHVRCGELPLAEHVDAPASPPARGPRSRGPPSPGGTPGRPVGPLRRLRTDTFTHSW
ncbi:hypothetical protein CEXT_147221 [Caerostris extrusa]|uniref:Uncharacterized protein n=1 Tax=Caerostris extrusa TaxID=172846 RepID=A0AAV4SYF8_CAEEX|nr:hypothetical protein CEXT_147221 [Caerostris extrusa]